MVEKQYDFNGRIYTVVACTKSDIPSHTERVLSYWEDTGTSISTQHKLLEKCIEADTAYKVVDDTGKSMSGIYLDMTSINTANCYFMFLVNKRMLAILFYYLRLTVNLYSVSFKPHDKKYIPFQFLLTESNIRMFRSLDKPLTIGVCSKRSQILYEDHYLRYGIKEL